MTKTIKNIIVSTLVLLVFGLTSCDQYEDVMTGDVETGGLVSVTGSVPYKLGSTPSFDITISIPQGSGIQSVKVYNTFYHIDADGDEVASAEVLMKTMDIGSANTSADVDEAMTLTLADMQNDISVSGYSFPANELELQIGDYWVLSYVSVMEDGREVVNNATSNIGVANFFAGSYEAHIIYWHPTAGGGENSLTDAPYVDTTEDKDLVAVNANTSKTWFGRWTDATIFITINDDNSIGFRTEGWDYDVGAGDPNDPSKVSSYDPATGVITLYYFYAGSGGNRVFHETFTPAN